MARIPDSEVERLRAEIDLVRLIETDGFELKRIGKDLTCACPFHEGDREPSLIVSPDKNLFHCFACGAAGSPIDWVMRRRGVAFRRAVELLRGEAAQSDSNSNSNSGSAEQGSTSSVPRAAASRVVAPLTPSADDQALLDDVIGFYHQTLRTVPEALAYLAKRGLTHPEMIDRFKLGYANRTLAYRLPEKQVQAGAAVRGQLQRLGILRVSGHEHFQGSLIVPVLDGAGHVTEVYGRKLVDKQREGVPLHLYLPGPHRGVFNVTDWRGSEEVILCESLIDALTFWCAGFRNVTSAFGVGGFTDELLQAFIAYDVGRVLIAFDADTAGDTAAAALAVKLATHGIESWRVVFPKGLDANAYACKAAPADRSLGLGLALKQVTLLHKATAQTARVAAPSAQIDMPESAPMPEPEVVASVAAEVSPLAAASIAAPLDSAAPVAINAEVSAEQVVIAFGERRYRVRGLAKNLSIDTLKVNILASAGENLHIDTFDLYAAKARQVYVKQTALALGVEESVIERDLARVLMQLETLQESAIRGAVTPKIAAPAVTPELNAAALALLRDPELAMRIVADVAAIGVVGEDANALVGYLACVSRKLERPLAVLIQSTSAAGKSTLMDALLSLMPEPERVHYSAMTGQSLFYLGEGDLKHKILAIAEEEGVRQAAYALKLLQSQGELTIASTGKDPTTGKLVTEEYRVEGPVMLFLTSTAIDLDEELLNRCMVLTINESREQTEAIHRRQRSARTLEGLLTTKHAESIRALHRAAQQLLRPVVVVNPYAEQLTFRSESTRMRRDHAKYLTLIDAIAFLHQHQRPNQQATVAGQVIEYVEVTLDDIALANRLASEVLGRSLDELPPQTRRVLAALDGLVRERAQATAMQRDEVRFTRREVRTLTGMHDTQVRVHLDRLVQLDYALPHRGQRGQSFVYELLFDGAADRDGPQLVGLIDVATLDAATTTQSSRGAKPSSRGSDLKFAGSSRPQRGALAGGSRSVEISRNASTGAAFTPLVAAFEETPLLRTPRVATQRRPNGATATP